MHVASFGNGSTVFFVAGGVFTGNKSEVGHEGPGGGEAANVVDLAEERQSGQGFDTAKAT